MLGGALRAATDEAATGERHGTAAHATEAGTRVPAEEDRGTGAPADVGAGQRQWLIVIAGKGAAVLIKHEDARARPQARQCSGLVAQGSGARQRCAHEGETGKRRRSIGHPASVPPIDAGGKPQALRKPAVGVEPAPHTLSRTGRAPRIHAWRGSTTC
ncbi:hypothetical protein G6F22_015460 [Rhizopus arrhizus]|nr:hypothetical protein G6F22_015460 [Rhizopus arrhizus]